MGLPLATSAAAARDVDAFAWIVRQGDRTKSDVCARPGIRAAVVVYADGS